MPETFDVSHNRFYIHILYSLRDKGFYIGLTTDLKQRLINHARGELKATKFRRSFKLIHYKYFINEHDAKAREIYLKSGYGRRGFKEMLKRTLTQLID